jgi:hypothetical protein
VSHKIHLEESCTVRFPGQPRDFQLGVEVGILLAQVDNGRSISGRWVAADNVPQLRELVAKMGLTMTVGETDGMVTQIAITQKGSARQPLRVVWRN